MAETVVCLQCRRPVFSPWVGQIHWRREWLPTTVFFPGQFHGPWSLVDYSPWSHKESDTSEQLTYTAGSHVGRKEKSFPFTHAIPRIATWWCQMAYVCLFSTGKTSRNLFFFFLLYLQGYQGVLSSLLFISIFNQGLIHKKILNGKSENLERVVNWGEKNGERK